MTPEPLLLSDVPDLARAHAIDEERLGYTPLPDPRPATFTWTETVDAVSIRIVVESLEVSARLEGLAPAVHVSGSHPRDGTIAYSAAMREASAASLAMSGRPVAGALFLHRGYEPWLARPARSGAVQFGETFVARST